MNIKKENAFQDIINNFESYANLVLQQLSLLEKVISSGTLSIDEEISRQLEQNERATDQYEIKLSEKIISTIVLQKPVASDLRKLMALYQNITNLERIGDMAINIAHALPKIKAHQPYHQVAESIANMLNISIQMVKKAILSFINSDREYAVWTIEKDESVDDMNHKMIKKAVSHSDVSDEMRDVLLSYVYISGIVSNIERIADHATNVAESTIYALEGRDIRHRNINDNEDQNH